MSNALNLIPAPQQIAVTEGRLAVTSSSRVSAATAEALEPTTLLAGIIGAPPPSVGGGGTINLSLGADGLGEEGYRLIVAPEGIRLEAEEHRGLYWGVQTIRQLLQSGGDDDPKGSLPCVTIEDRPRFSWRGLLFDCCRHFMDVDFVKKTIDLLAYHKMNVLHWHLTEDQGWRIEIKSHPELTDIGAWRNPNAPYGGFYTQEQIKSVVEYATARGVMVVPEIEVPGHSMAALAAYPELSCTGGPFQVGTTWGIIHDIFCAGKEETFRLLEDVLEEVIELFPSPYIHIGADEAPKDRWKGCPRCQERMRQERLGDEEALQAYFVQRISQFLAEKGKQAVGWDEIMEGNPSTSSVIVEAWQAKPGMTNKIVEAARAGYRVLASTQDTNYFDYHVSRIDLSRAYAYTPIPEGLSTEEQKRIIGGECCMWTEFAPQRHVETMLYPRILATAENLWTAPAAEERRPAAFYTRVKAHCRRLDAMGVNYGAAYPAGGEPG